MCNPGFYLKSDKECSPCITNCDVCRNDTTCEGCNANFDLDLTTKLCKDKPVGTKILAWIGILLVVGIIVFVIIYCFVCKAGYFINKAQRDLNYATTGSYNNYTGLSHNPIQTNYIAPPVVRPITITQPRITQPSVNLNIRI